MTPDKGGLQCFLRHVETGKFFKAPAAWTDKLAEAHEFEEPYDALRAAYTIGTEELEIVFRNARDEIIFGTYLGHAHFPDSVVSGERAARTSGGVPPPSIA